MYELKQLFKTKVKLNIRYYSTFFQKFYVMTVWVPNLHPSNFCLPMKCNNQLIYVMLLSYAYQLAEACHANQDGLEFYLPFSKVF